MGRSAGRAAGGRWGSPGAQGPCLTLAPRALCPHLFSLRSWTRILGSGPELLAVPGEGREKTAWGRRRIVPSCARARTCVCVCVCVCVSGRGCCLGVSDGGSHACFQMLRHGVCTGLCTHKAARLAGIQASTVYGRWAACPGAAGWGGPLAALWSCVWSQGVVVSETV